MARSCVEGWRILRSSGKMLDFKALVASFVIASSFVVLVWRLAPTYVRPVSSAIIAACVIAEGMALLFRPAAMSPGSLLYASIFGVFFAAGGTHLVLRIMSLISTKKS